MQSLIDHQLSAYNERNLDSFCECYHREVQVIDSVSNEIIVDGIEAFRVFYKKLFDSSPSLHCEIKTRIVHEKCVVDEESVTGISSRKDSLHAVVMYTFKEQKIHKVLMCR